jgi:flagellar motor switch protein FliM
LVTPLKIQVAETESTMHLVYPLESLKPIRESLQQRIVAGDGEEEMHRKWLNDLSEAVENVPLEVRAKLSEIHTTLGEFNQLKEGDTLWFKRPKATTIEIAGIELFAAEMGASDGQAAVQITHALTSDNAPRRK